MRLCCAGWCRTRLGGVVGALVWIAVMTAMLPATVAAQSFGLVPNNDGQLDPWVSLAWQWSDDLRGRVDLRSRSETRFDDQPAGGFVEQALTTVERSYHLALDPLVWAPQLAPDAVADPRLAVGIGLHGEYWSIRETGYVDFLDPPADAPVTVRLFFNNLRRIYAVKPAVVAGFSIGIDGLSLDLNAAYVPWMAIVLNHELSSSSTVSAYTTPVTTGTFDGNSYHAWRVGGTFDVRLGPVSLNVEGGAGGAEYAYSMIALGGGTANAQVYVVDGFLRGLVAVDSLSLGGLVPQLGFGFETVGSLDRLVPGSEWSTSTVPRFAVGFKVM